MKPILKWVGGKDRVIPEIEKYIPAVIERYIEPFAGGGALFFDKAYQNAWINDYNKELINVYNQIKKSKKKVIEIIDNFKKEYNKKPKLFFYWLRSLDRNKMLFDNLSDAYKAARTIFLNKTNFNGIYRVNKSGHFNTPWGQYDRAPTIYDEDNLDKISEYLKNVKITNLDYKKMQKEITKGDFVYLDPPYHKLKRDTFTQYNADTFGKEEQIEVRNFCDELNEKGVKFIVSNHNTNFIREIYKKYTIKIIKVKRMVNSKGDERGEIQEVLIMNY